MRSLRARLAIVFGLILVAFAVHLWAVDGPLTNAMNLRVRTDGNGYLVAASGVYSGVDGPLTAFANIRLRTDQNGYLLVAYGGAPTFAGATFTGTTTFPGGTVVGSTGNITIGTSLILFWNGRNVFSSTADGQTIITSNAGTSGLELNVGVPTLGTCTGGTLVSGAHNFGGEVTGNTSGVCTINFGTPNFTNTPFCVLNDETTLTAIRISARSTAAITITGAVSGDAFQFICLGRVGT